MSSPLSPTMHQILDRFDEAWNGPARPRIEDYLADAEPAERLPLLIELVRIDLERRLTAGDKVRLEETYGKRFPELLADPSVILALVKREIELRRRNEPDLSADEYRNRFPQFCDELHPHLPTKPRSGVEQKEIASTNSPDGSDRPDPLVGRVLRDRYRIVQKLGEGGMGVVCLAEDRFINNEKVALKFLRKDQAGDLRWRELLTKEVSIAQKVTHRYVCRIHNIDFLPDDLQPFVIMEYIEGENLKKWMEKQGLPLPGEAVKWARQLCEGLWALHFQDLLHRDLKPANVMLGENKRSGEREVKLTDFGLAALEGDISRSRIGDGTLAYQAPEQLVRKEVTWRSDIYSLGLILYELFTGKLAFPLPSDADGKECSMPFDEFIRIRKQGEFLAPRKHVPELDPRIERVIVRCLQPSPEDRPHSVLVVLGALPGANPEELARFAGETPPPDVAADVGEEGVLSLWSAATMLLLALLCLIGVCFLADKAMLHRQEPPDWRHTPEKMLDIARDVIEIAGQKIEKDRDHFSDIWLTNLRYREQLKNKEMNKSEAIVTLYSYRQSLSYLAATDNRSLGAGIITPKNPPLQPGMVGVTLDSKGRLLEFYYVPRTLESAGELLDRDRRSVKNTVWKILKKSGFGDLEEGEYKKREDTENINPPMSCNVEIWEREISVFVFPNRIEIGTCGDGLVYIRPGDRNDWASPYDNTASYPLTAPLFIMALTVAIWFAIRNYHLGRADLRGAIRLSLFLTVNALFAGLLGIDHILALEEMDMLLSKIGSLGTLAILIGVCYLAMEPSVRKRWPSRISAWHRVLKGQFLDPLVGRDVLIGCLLGIVCLFLRELAITVAPLLHIPTVYITHLDVVVASKYASPGPFYYLLMTPLVGVGFGLFSFFVAFLLYRVLPKKTWLPWLAYYLLTVAVTAYQLLPSIGSYPADELLWTVLSLALCWGVAVYVTWRFGLLASIIAFFTHLLLILAPMTSDFNVWYVWRTILVLILVAGLTIYGCLCALGGPARATRLIFGDD